MISLIHPFSAWGKPWKGSLFCKKSVWVFLGKSLENEQNSILLDWKVQEYYWYCLVQLESRLERAETFAGYQPRLFCVSRLSWDLWINWRIDVLVLLGGLWRTWMTGWKRWGLYKTLLSIFLRKYLLTLEKFLFLQIWVQSKMSDFWKTPLHFC